MAKMFLAREPLGERDQEAEDRGNVKRLGNERHGMVDGNALP